MQATLHLPNTEPRLLTNVELLALDIHQSSNQHLALGVPPSASILAKLLGTSISCEVLASSPSYLIVVPANAADYDFGPTLSVAVDFERLVGIELGEDNPLVGPLLVIEA